MEKQQVLTPEELERFNKTSTANDAPPWIIVPFFGLFVTIGFGMLGVGLRSKTGFPVLFGSLFGGMPWLMSWLFLGRMWYYTLFPWAILVFIQGDRFGGARGGVMRSAIPEREAAPRLAEG